MSKNGVNPKKYRKRPVVVEAFHWLYDDVPTWISRAIQNGKIGFDAQGMIIHTLEGAMIASPGDYIIKGIRGELYPCKPDIFEKTYEEVTQ